MRSAFADFISLIEVMAKHFKIQGNNCKVSFITPRGLIYKVFVRTDLIFDHRVCALKSTTSLIFAKTCL